MTTPIGAIPTAWADGILPEPAESSHRDCYDTVVYAYFQRIRTQPDLASVRDPRLFESAVLY